MATYKSKYTGEQIDKAVGDVLNGNVGSGGATETVELDATLTQAGKAADAKATGDRLTALSEEIKELKGEGEVEPVTYIATITGIFSVSNKTILQGDGYGFHTDYIPLDGYTHIKATYKLTNTAYALAFFDESKNLIPDLSIIGEGTDKFYVIDMDVPAGAAYCMMSDYKWGATQGTGSITISGGSAK
jgi:hypothetical protein